MMGRQRFRYDIRREDLERLRAAGYGRIPIAQLYGCEQTTITYWLRKFGLPTAQPRVGPSRAKIEAMLKAAEEWGTANARRAT